MAVGCWEVAVSFADADILNPTDGAGPSYGLEIDINPEFDGVERGKIPMASA